MMTATQGDVELLRDPVAQALLDSRQPTRFAYTWADGTPRVVPVCFTWTGEAIVIGTPPGAPKLIALRERYLGEEQSRAWLAGLRGQPMARVAVIPRCAAVLDFETRFPSALSL